MSLRIEVDLASGVPPYEQIRLQVLAHVSARRLRAGDRLPTIRALATDLGVASGTVARAYRELEAAGVVTTRRRVGTVVTDVTPSGDAGLRDAARRLVEEARSAGLDDDAVLGLVRGALLGGRDDTRPTEGARHRE
ncbi:MULTISPECIES: GntR family transcriptional regulator [unclassified Actinotalea]|uniref:GntR family transcriptional regulator n=1 Tax=unclassified Actinotalea TaxID=2638618 RepID=UPI0015F6601D|nr:MULTISPECIES: GntR family transcriptional regulator [unclassified Actinotalea]